MILLRLFIFLFFFFNDTATTEIYTLSLHDALPISVQKGSLVPSIADESGFRRRLWIGPCIPVRQRTQPSPSRASLVVLNGDTARVDTKSRLPPPGLLSQDFDREWDRTSPMPLAPIFSRMR